MKINTLSHLLCYPISLFEKSNNENISQTCKNINKLKKQNLQININSNVSCITIQNNQSDLLANYNLQLISKQIHDTLYEAKKPIISGINGVALGGGCQLALLTDVILCSQQARFALPELKLGLIPGIGGTQRLARISGRINAMRYVLTSEFINAKRAYELGIVTQVVPYPQLHAKVIEKAKEMTNKPLSALLAAKQVIKQNENLSMRQGQQLEKKVLYRPGFKEGVKAFIQKQKPNHFHL